MSIDANVDLAGSLSVSLGKIQASIDTLSSKVERENQARLAAYPRQVPFFQLMTSVLPASGLVDLDGPRMGREWEVRIASVVAMNSANSAWSTFPTSGSGTTVSNTFAGAAAGSVSLPAGASISGFTVDLQAGTATDYVVTVTNAVGGTQSFNVQGQAGGTVFTQTFNPPIPAINSASQITVNVPAQAGGPAYSIEASGVVGATASPVVTFYEGQNVASPAPGILSAGLVRWQFAVVPGFENFSADQFILHQNTRLIIGATGIPAGINLYVQGVINDIPKASGIAVTVGG